MLPLVFVGAACFVTVLLCLLLTQADHDSAPHPEAASSHVAGGVLRTLASSVGFRIRPGMGAGASYGPSQRWTGAPFPLRDGAIVAFDINFDPGFEWSCQGKIGGLFIGTGSASGGDHSPNGASHRLMWDQNGTAKSYVYVPAGTEGRQPAPLNQKRDYGQGVFEKDFQQAFRTGTWHRVELGVKLNSVTGSGANPDGAMLLSIDGKSRVLRNVIWRQSRDTPVTSLHFNVFHGGGCVATKHSSLTLRNVRIHSWSG